jgi:ABC-2 type transport system ATP-binding protein
MITIENISKTFGKKEVLSNICFTISEGNLVALIGENGAGKTTLMRIMTGFLSASQGLVKIYNKNITEQRIDALSYIGYVPEISALYGDMLVYDFLKWIANIWKINDIDKAIITTSKQMDIIDVLNEKIENLSKGYKKRVEIASAIIHSPKVLILDEPTDGLDPNQKKEIRSFMKSYSKKNIVIVSTHVLEDIECVDRVIMISKGKLVKDAPIKEFKKTSQKNSMSEAFSILSNKQGCKK